MFVALDIDKKRVHANNAYVNGDWRCPSCGKLLTYKKGQIRRAYFAHRKSNICTDTWSSGGNNSYDVSDWHNDWQNEYPIENQEIQLTWDSITHRADVLTGRTVIEFQHSSISEEHFSERNNFYFNFGYKIVWLFDMRELYSDGKIQNVYDNDNEFSWIRPYRAFKFFDRYQEQAELFFQLKEMTDNQECIVKIKRTAKTGFEKFTILKWYTKQEFLDYTKTHDGIYEAPLFYDDLTNNEEFQRYKSKYNIQLTKEQDRAVQSVEGAVLLLAVPGSGKTSTMIARLGYMMLCKGIPSENILVISYTNAAADELRRRMTSTFNFTDGSGIKIATINSFCLEIINQYSLIKNKKNPYNLKSRQSSLYEFFSKRKNIKLTKSELIEYDTTIGYIKNMMLFENEYELAQVDSDRIYIEYVNYCKENNYMDYDDQLIFAYKILLSTKDIRNTLENKYRYISVDEAQDNSKLQHEIIRLIAEKNNNIFMVGDEDQSIFGFRGAYPRALLKFRNTYKNTFNLQIKRNFRSTANIIDTANRFIEVNTDRETKKMVPVKEAGNQVIIRKVASRSEQFQDLVSRIKNSTNQIVILARLNDSLIPLINLLVENNIPYRINKEYQLTFFNSKNYTNLMNRLNSMNQNTKPTDAIAEIAWSTDVINRNYLDNMYIISENYETINDFKNRLLVLQKEVEKSNTEKDITAPIVLSTIHSSKGMEFNEVYLIDVYDGIFPLSNSKSNYYSTKHEMEQEERRLFYVGLTRAINSLNIFCINNRESCFVNELYSDSGSVGVSHGSNHNYKMDLIDHIRKINEEIHKKIAEREKAEHERRIAEFYEKQKAIEEEQRIKLEQAEQLRIKQENERKAREEDKKRKKRELDEECYQYALQCFEDGQLSMFGVQEPERGKVIDRTGRRWFRCIYCNEIKPEAEIWTYGGSLGLRDGKCKMCQKNGNS